ncbi:amino acid ABC transporter substrate-binding protein [Maridesulfovibrio hydrothermalis]|uniref:Extracellular solute-binding protein family 3 n=1 Tax=Maridesulfovibrio hydrothermalis AM13 = DSM 14728 TaxID=1121451 RepID=L0R672_9BACT|nr:amino acid ABC transporter substrate-binding protein [Maridesulfovibrio hydrothermalis]CCO22189.1 Extracellular solute-binding protein family 3 [Maridesulfovibrio hydrothermalis AM13 = DSM 14728]
MKRVLLIVMVAMVLAFATAAQADDGSWNRVKEAGQLVIGLDDAFPPMGFRQDDGKLVGFDVDAAEELGKRLGIKIVWQPTAWSGVVHSLNAKKFDCIWNGMTITPERQKAVLFTKPYIRDGQIAVVVMGNDKITSTKQVGGKIVGVQKGSPALEAAKSLKPAAKEIREYDTNPKAFLDLEAARLDVVVIDNIAGRYFMSTRPGKYIALPGYITTEAFGIAFRKADKSLEAKIQMTIDAMVADGTMGKISRKWFGEDITNPAKW